MSLKASPMHPLKMDFNDSNAPFEDEFQWLPEQLYLFIIMKGLRQKAETSWSRANSLHWMQMYIAAASLSLWHTERMTVSWHPWHHDAITQLAGELNMTKNMDGLSWNFFCSHIAHSIFLWKPERKWENSFLFLSFAIDLYCLRMSNRKHKWEVNKSRAKTESVEYIYQGLITEKVNWQPLGCLVFSPI